MTKLKNALLSTVSFIVLLALLGGGISSAQSGSVFEIQGTKPVVSHGADGNWDGTFTDPGAVFYYGGKYHMFRNGFQAWPASVEWGYVTSTDGYTWTKQGDQPVFHTAQVPYAGTAALASSALVLPNGTWVVYFYTYGAGGDTSGNWSIGRATAPGPTGPWKADAQPVLKPGPGDSWDATISTPSVLQTDKGFVMYFDGAGSNGVEMIGMATSTDGINWTKYNDPSTGDKFAESDPVLMPSSDSTAFDGYLVHRPRVQMTPQGFVMLFRTTKRTADSITEGYALSDDGIHWRKSASNPVVTAAVVPGATGIYFSNLVYHDNTYFAFLEMTSGSVSDIYLAVHKGPLPTAAMAEPSATSIAPSPQPNVTVAPTPMAVPTVSLPGQGSRTYPETGKTVHGIFLDYWQQHGGLAQQGYPISDVMGEVSDLNGKPYTVQYFERAVFEYHPENAAPNNVLLSQLGTFQYHKKYHNGAPNQQANNSAGSQLFTQTGMRVGGKFLQYWQQHGGLAQQGYPISNEFEEKSDLDGKTYKVQYFERAVFEMHPENQSPYDVLLSQLGSFQYSAKYSGK